MCGIVGFVSEQKRRGELELMLNVLSYRGPDHSGLFYDDDNGVYLGHRRLAIQDISTKGSQPFKSNCGNYIIIFNGEIYNFKDIRKELKKKGIQFISNSDTEVVLYSYIVWGVECLQRFIGMFAFAIYDKKEKNIFLVRDRAGVKPLYYYSYKNKFIFASELKSFSFNSDFYKILNKKILPHYFMFGYIPSPHSIYKNCYKMEPGHYAFYDLCTKKLVVAKYWDVDDYYGQEKFDKSESEILEELEFLLKDAVNLRMISDVPVGVFLSGGYDSSLVTSLLSSRNDLKTFTIGFDDKKYDEAAHAKKIAAYFGTNHTEYYMQDIDMLSMVRALPFYYDEPFGDSSALSTMVVSKLAKNNVSVVLSADGGDETFCGYSKYFFLSRFEKVNSNLLMKKFFSNFMGIVDEDIIYFLNSLLPKNIKQTNIKDKFNKFKRAISARNKEDMFFNASSYVSFSDVYNLLNFDFNDFKFENNCGMNLLDYMMSTDYKTFMTDDVLTKVDRATMSVSLEGREPLLDHRLIEFMARVPNKIKYKNRQGKYLLRKILYKKIPQTLVDKPKSGFQIPLYEWLKNDLKPLVEEFLDPNVLDSEIFNIKVIEKMRCDFFKGKYVNINYIWFIVVFQMWKKLWFDK